MGRLDPLRREAHPLEVADALDDEARHLESATAARDEWAGRSEHSEARRDRTTLTLRKAADTIRAMHLLLGEQRRRLEEGRT